MNWLVISALFAILHVGLGGVDRKCINPSSLVNRTDSNCCPFVQLFIFMMLSDVGDNNVAAHIKMLRKILDPCIQVEGNSNRTQTDGSDLIALINPPNLYPTIQIDLLYDIDVLTAFIQPTIVEPTEDELRNVDYYNSQIFYGLLPRNSEQQPVFYFITDVSTEENVIMVSRAGLIDAGTEKIMLEISTGLYGQYFGYESKDFLNDEKIGDDYGLCSASTIPPTTTTTTTTKTTKQMETTTSSTEQKSPTPISDTSPSFETFSSTFFSTSSPPKDKNFPILIIILSIIGGTLLLLFFGGVVYGFCIKKNANIFFKSEARQNKSQRTLVKENDDSVGQFERNELRESLSLLDKWNVPKKDLHIFDFKLGSGAFASVYKGFLKGIPPVARIHPMMQNRDKVERNKVFLQLSFAFSNEGNYVAVKTTLEKASQGEKEEFLNEIEFMKKLDYHPHVLSLVGSSISINNPFILTELCDLGDLLSLVRKVPNQDSALEPNDFLPISWQVSDALDFFSNRNIVHRDVAARNILINKNKTAKLSDFGLCRFSSEMFYKSRGGKLPLKWMAPEAIEYAQFSTKSDVWSFGVLLYEMYSFGKTPFHSTQQEEVLTQLKEGKRIEKPEMTPELIKDLMDECWNENPFGRPNFSEIRQKLYREMEENQASYKYLHFSKNYYKTTSKNG